ncbi:S-layer homology domain-containing protein [Intestinimonas sp.]|nr:S-layer homology domain-containing protein [Intestinimonas sp.]
MRNLKRALSLALASVMVLSMMVIGAGAASYDDFSDKEEIVNKEAVSVLVELGVIAGKDDGSYDPTGIITRAEMAKLICTVLNGGKDPNLGNVVTYTYADTVGHWAAPYIEYCTQLGIVAGDGAGNFNPNVTVTGSEAAKMLLVATGYNAKIEGYVGANWEVTTNVRANMIGLYDGLEINPSEGLTRDAAAQMVYNDLDALVVTYKYTLGTDGNSIATYPELVETNSAGKRVTVLEDKFGAVKVEAVVTSNDVATLNNNYRSAEDAGETYLAVTKDSPSGTSGIYAVDTDKALLGQTVNAYIKYKDDRQIVTDAVVIGAPIPTADNKIVTSNDGTGLNDLLDDNKLTVNDATEYYCNFGGTVKADKTVVAMTRAEFNALCGTTGVGITLIDNDNDKDVDYALAEQYRYGTVNKYTEDGFRIGGSVYDEDYEPEEVIGYEDVARDDFVLYTEFGGNIYVQKPETQEAVLDAFSTSKKTVKLDGETIDWSGIQGVMNSELMDLDTHLTSGTALDASAVWYKDIFGYVFAVGNADENNLSYAVLLGYENQTKGNAGTLGDTARAKLLLADGTVDTYKVATIDGDKVTNCTSTSVSGSGVGFDSTDLYKIYSYTKTESGSMKLTEKLDVHGKADTNTIEYVKGKSTIDVDTGNFTVTSNTVFLYMKPNGSVARFEGKSAPSINDSMAGGNAADALDDASVTVAVQANSRGEALVVFLNGVNPSNDFTDNFVYIYNRKLVETSDGYEVSAIIDGKIETIVITDAKKGDGSGNSLIKEGWYDDDSNSSTPDVYGHYIDYPAGGTATNDGLYTYSKNDDNTYVLRHADSTNLAVINNHVVKGVVNAVSYSEGKDYVRVGGKSYTLTDSTLGFYARTGKTAKADVTVSKGDDVVLVINDDDEIIYSFVTFYAYDKDETPVTPPSAGDYKVNASESMGTVTVKYYGSYTTAEIVAAVKAAMKAETVKPDFAGNKIEVDGITYTLALTPVYRLTFNGTVIGYSDSEETNFVFEAPTATANAIKRADSGTASAPAYTAAGSKFTVPVSAISAADVDLVVAYKVTKGTGVDDVKVGSTDVDNMYVAEKTEVTISVATGVVDNVVKANGTAINEPSTNTDAVTAKHTPTADTEYTYVTK